MPTSLSNVVLPDSGRPQQIMNVSASAAGVYEAVVVPEGDALSFTVYVSSIAATTLLDIKVEELGASPTNKRLLASVPQINKALGDPVTLVVPVGGRALITAATTGAVDFEVHGKTTTAAATTLKTPILTELSVQEKEFWQRNEQLLIQINNSLKIMNNHLRLITGMEKEKIDGGSF